MVVSAWFQGMAVSVTPLPVRVSPGITLLGPGQSALGVCLLCSPLGRTLSVFSVFPGSLTETVCAVQDTLALLMGNHDGCLIESQPEAKGNLQQPQLCSRGREGVMHPCPLWVSRMTPPWVRPSLSTRYWAQGDRENGFSPQGLCSQGRKSRREQLPSQRLMCFRGPGRILMGNPGPPHLTEPLFHCPRSCPRAAGLCECRCQEEGKLPPQNHGGPG